MDDPNLETKDITPVPLPPHRVGFLRPFVLIIVLILIGVGGWLIFHTSKTNKVSIPSNQTQTNVQTQASSTVVDFGNQPGILPSGFPPDLAFDPNATTTKDNISYSYDGKSVIIDRVYETNMSLSVSKTLINLLSKKGWQTNEVPTSDNKQATYKVSKDVYSASIIMNQIDPSHSSIEVMVSFLKPQ